jgi:hypothetical protein
VKKILLPVIAGAALSLSILQPMNVAAAHTRSANELLSSVLKSVRSAGPFELSGQLGKGATAEFYTYRFSSRSLSTSWRWPTFGVRKTVASWGQETLAAQCSTFEMLRMQCGVSNPTRHELGKWYNVVAGDPRFLMFSFGHTLPSSFREAFSIDSSGFGPTAKFAGTTTLAGQHVIKLKVTSFLTPTSGNPVSGSGILFVSAGPHPHLVGLRQLVASTGVLYYHRISDTAITTPATEGPLPQ